MRITADALSALQHAAEDHLVGVFMDAELCRQRAKKETLKADDMRLAIKIRRDRLPPLDSSVYVPRSGTYTPEIHKWKREDGVADRH